MKSFTLSLLAASVSAVRIQNGGFSQREASDELFQNLAAKIEEQVTLGSISVVDQDNMGSELKLKSVVPVSSPAEQIESVIDQVKEGFELIAEINAEAEEEQIEDTQDKQEDAINEVMEEANDEAADIIEDEDDASEAAEEVEEVMEDAADAIADINKGHDREVSKIAKTTFVAEITNETVKDKILREIVGAASAGEDVNKVIAQQHLPFDVQTPFIVNDKEGADMKLDRIVCRSGDCVGNIKKDPEFDSFLGKVLNNFEEYKRQPEFASSDYYYNEADYLPTAPQRLEAIGAPARPGAVSLPGEVAPVVATKRIEAAMQDRRYRDQIPAGFDFDRTIPYQQFDPAFSYKPEYTGHGLDLTGLSLERGDMGTMYEGFQVPQMEVNVSDRMPKREVREVRAPRDPRDPKQELPTLSEQGLW